MTVPGGARNRRCSTFLMISVTIRNALSYLTLLAPAEHGADGAAV